MSTAVLEDYLKTIPDARAEPMVRQLDRIIRKTHPGFDVAIKYKILMYALKGDFHTWVCATNAGRRKVSLSFLYGVMLEDARHVGQKDASGIAPASGCFRSFAPCADTACGAYLPQLCSIPLRHRCIACLNATGLPRIT